MDKYLLLLERTPLVDLLRYLKKTCPPGIDVDRESIAREWRSAAERTREDRVYALRRRGITHVPCLVQDITHDEELDIIGAGEIRQRIDRYMRLERPPLFKDYFDERLTKLLDAPRSYTMVHIQVSSQCIAVPMPSGEDGGEMAHHAHRMPIE